MRSKLNFILEWTLAILLALMTLDVLWGVLTRYLLNAQSSWTDELARYLLIWIGMMGAAYASGQNLHIAIDLISATLSQRNQKRLTAFIAMLISAFVFLAFIIGGIRYVYIAFKLGQQSPALHIPMGVVYGIFPLAGFIIIYFKLNDLQKLFSSQINNN